MLNSGKLNKRIEIQFPSAGSPPVNEFGEPTVCWGTLCVVWASIEPITGREFWAQQQVQGEATVRFKIRYKSGIESGMRILYNDKIYMIKNVMDLNEAHTEMHLMTSEGVRDGD